MTATAPLPAAERAMPMGLLSRVGVRVDGA